MAPDVKLYDLLCRGRANDEVSSDLRGCTLEVERCALKIATGGAPPVPVGSARTTNDRADLGAVLGYCLSIGEMRDELPLDEMGAVGITVGELPGSAAQQDKRNCCE